MRLTIALLVIAATCLGTPRTTLAQDISPDFRVGAILHDAQGRYWFGTAHHGVYRLDGQGLASFTTADGLADNQVRNILEDPRGTIWFDTASGVSRYDGNAIHSVTSRDYTSNDTWKLNRDDLWFKGQRPSGYTPQEGQPGAYRFDGTTLKYHAFPLDIPQHEHDGHSVTAIHQGDGDSVWIATYDAVIGFDGERFTVIDNDALGHTDETGRLHARAVFEDNKGRVWIGDNGLGVILWEAGTASNFTQAHRLGRRMHDGYGWTRDPAPGDAPPGEPTLHRVFAIGEDSAGNIWFGTPDQGAWRFDGTVLRQFTEEDGLMTKSVFSFHLDRDGNLLLGGHGVFRFDGTVFERLI